MAINITYTDLSDSLINSTAWVTFNLNIPSNGEFSNWKIVHSFTPASVYTTDTTSGITTTVNMNSPVFNTTPNLTVQSWKLEYNMDSLFLYTNYLTSPEEWSQWPLVIEKIEEILTDNRQKIWDSARLKVMTKASMSTSNGGTGKTGGTGGTGGTNPVVLFPKVNSSVPQSVINKISKKVS